PNCEISEPDTKALSPWPWKRMTRTLSSFSSVSITVGSADHMSSVIALCLAAWSMVTVATAPLLAAWIRPGGSSDDILTPQRLQSIVTHVNFVVNGVVVVARHGCDLSQRGHVSAQPHRLTDQPNVAKFLVRHGPGNAQVLDLHVFKSLLNV